MPCSQTNWPAILRPTAKPAAKSEARRGHLKINHNVETGLKDFVCKYYDINEEITWEYSWSGIMATSSTGLPFIGPTNHPLVFACSGYTGHGFSWAHGSAKLCAQIITGEPTPSITHLFNPNKK